MPGIEGTTPDEPRVWSFDDSKREPGEEGGLSYRIGEAVIKGGRLTLDNLTSYPEVLGKGFIAKFNRGE